MMENLNRAETEIRDQAHLMDAEGTCDNEPTKDEIIEYLKGLGWHAYFITVYFDGMQNTWRWYCDIKPLTPHN